MARIEITHGRLVEYTHFVENGSGRMLRLREVALISILLCHHTSPSDHGRVSGYQIVAADEKPRNELVSAPPPTPKPDRRVKAEFFRPIKLICLVQSYAET
jgi:hypothetical protein